MTFPEALSDLDVALFEVLTVFGAAKHHTSDLERGVSVKVNRLLNEGANPNAINPSGVSPLGMVGQVFTRTSEHASKVIGDLIQIGADPMKYDHAFSRFCKSKKECVREEFVLCMVSQMCKKEFITGVKFLSDKGQNPLQVLISKNVPTASLVFQYLWEGPVEAKLDEWLSARDAKGNTVLHALWADKGIVSRTLNTKTSPEESNSITSAAWNLQNKVESIPGYRMWDQNNAGISVYDLISKRMNQGMPLDESCEIAKWFKSQRQADQMQQSAAQYAHHVQTARRI